MTKTTRYFKFTDGERTFFRATKTRVYLSGKLDAYGIGFSGKPASLGTFPAVEIDKPEYDRLTAIKAKRLGAIEARYVSPGDSWVLNSLIVPKEVEPGSREHLDALSKFFGI